MAILCKLSEIKKHIAVTSELDRYLHSLKNKTIEKAKEIAINGRSVFASENLIETKMRDKMPYESHRKYIDVHIVLNGKELIELAHISALEPSTPYNEEKDYLLYKNTPGDQIHLKPGICAIFFPQDAHMPGIGKGTIQKIVLKIKVDR